MQLIDTRPEYPPEWDDAEAKEMWIDNRADELLTDEMQPFTADNITEWLCNISLKANPDIALLIENAIESNSALAEACEQYWRDEAFKAAEREFDNGDFDNDY